MEMRTGSGLGRGAREPGRRIGAVASAGLGAVLALVVLAVGADSEEAPGSDFLRFVETGKGEGRLETAVVRYRDDEGVEVDLIAAVHIGDPGYYRKLQRRFTAYDALLYEMIKEPGVEIVPERPSNSLLSTFQRALKDVLELEFQLDAIDYTPKNFVHADMDPRTFFRLQREKGESVLSLMLNAMLEQWRQQSEGKGTGLTGFHLLAALLSPDRAHALKYLFAREFESVETTLAGVDRGADGKGSVLLSGRNSVAIRVLEKEIGRGRRHLGIFYGAGHMTDLEKRLYRLGFRRQGQKWLTAWDVRRGGAGEESEAGGEKGAGGEDPPAREHPDGSGKRVRVSGEPEAVR